MANGQAQLSTLNPQLFGHMKILPPADENERQALKLRLEEALGAEQGGSWRVDIIAGRYGWYVRPVRVRPRAKGERRQGRSDLKTDRPLP